MNLGGHLYQMFRNYIIYSLMQAVFDSVEGLV